MSLGSFSNELFVFEIVSPKHFDERVTEQEFVLTIVETPAHFV